MIYGQDEVPVYSSIFSVNQKKPEHRTSSSALYPRRTSGTLSEVIIIRGVENIPSFYTAAHTVGGAIDFKLGWNDFLNGNRKIIPITAMLENFVIDFNYFSSPQPSYLWTATFIGVVNDKVIVIEPLIPHLDTPVCANKLCDKTIVTTDTTLHGGFVFHVKRASISNKIIRNLYMTASSNNHYVPTKGVRDRTIEMEVQGDFDYWIDAARGDSRFSYSYFFSAVGQFTAANMKVTNVNNFVINIQTGEILSALVHLGASY